MSKKFAWSYSSLTAFETCPRRWYLTKWVKQVVEPQTEATLWGNRVHKAMEERLADKKPLPPTMEKYETIAQTLLKHADGGKLEVEQKLALNENLRPTTYFAKDVWLRSIADVVVTKGDKAFIGDHKTGKVTPGSSQLKLSAAVVFAHKPWVKTIVNAFIWLKENKTTQETFHREDLPEIWQEFIPRVNRITTAIEKDKFPPNPSGLCRAHCPVHTCEYNGKYTGK